MDERKSYSIGTVARKVGVPKYKLSTPLSKNTTCPRKISLTTYLKITGSAAII